MTFFRPSRVLHKVSGTPGEIIDSADLNEGEIAINNAADAPFIMVKDTNGDIVGFQANAGGVSSDIGLYVALTGDPSPTDPLNGDAFALPSQAIAWGRENLGSLNGYTLTINISDGTYLEPSSLVFPDLGGSLAISGASMETTIIQSSVNGDAFVHNTATRVDYSELTFEMLAIDAVWKQQLGLARVRNCTFTGSGEGGLVVSAGSIMEARDSSAKGLTVNAKLLLAGELHLSSLLNLNRNGIAEDLCLDMEGGKMYTTDEAGITINVLGSSKAVSLVSTDEVPYGFGLWTGDPVFTTRDTIRPFPLEVSSVTEPGGVGQPVDLEVYGTSRLRGRTTIEDVRIIGGQYTFFVDGADGVEVPPDPYGGDKFDLPSSAMLYIRDRVIMTGDASITVKIAPGNYLETRQLQIPNVGGQVNLLGPDTGSGPQTVTIDQQYSVSQGLRIDCRTGTIGYFKYMPGAANSNITINNIATIQFDRFTYEAGSNDGQLRIGEGAVVKTVSNSAPAIELIGATLRNDGELWLNGGHVSIDYAGAEADTCMINSGKMNLTSNNFNGRIDIVGTAKTVEIKGTDDFMYAPGRWTGDPVFIFANTVRPIPMVLGLNSTQTDYQQKVMLNVQGIMQMGIFPDVASLGPGGEGQVAYVGGTDKDFYFHNGSGWTKT